MKNILFILLVIFANITFIQAQKSIKTEIYIVEQTPEFYLGNESFMAKLKVEIIKKNIKVKAKTTFDIRLTIDKKGKLVDVEVKKADAAIKNKVIQAINAIENKWTVGKVNGVALPSILNYSIIISPKNKVLVSSLGGRVIRKSQ